MTISKRGRPKGQPGRCSVCKGSGHNSRSCAEVLKCQRKVGDKRIEDDIAIACHTAEEQDIPAARTQDLSSPKVSHSGAAATASYFGSQHVASDEKKGRSLTHEEASYVWANDAQLSDAAGVRPPLNPKPFCSQGPVSAAASSPDMQMPSSIAEDVQRIPYPPSSPPTGIILMAPASLPPNAPQEETEVPMEDAGVLHPSVAADEDTAGIQGSKNNDNKSTSNNSLELSLNLKLAPSQAQLQGGLGALPPCVVDPIPLPSEDPVAVVVTAEAVAVGVGMKGKGADKAEDKVQVASPQTKKLKENRLQEILAMTGGVSPTSRMPLLSLRPPQVFESARDGRERSAAEGTTIGAGLDMGSQRLRWSREQQQQQPGQSSEDGGIRAVTSPRGGRPPLGRAKRVMVTDEAAAASSPLSPLGQRPAKSMAEAAAPGQGDLPPPPKRQMTALPPPAPLPPPSLSAAVAKFPWAERLRQIMAMELPEEANAALAAATATAAASSSSSHGRPGMGEGGGLAEAQVPVDKWREPLWQPVEEPWLGRSSEDMNDTMLCEIINSILPVDAALLRWRGAAVTGSQEELSMMDGVHCCDVEERGDDGAAAEGGAPETVVTPSSVSGRPQQVGTRTSIKAAAAAANAGAASHVADEPTTASQPLVPHVSRWFTGQRDEPLVAAAAAGLVGTADAITPAEVDLATVAAALSVTEVARYQHMSSPSVSVPAASVVSGAAAVKAATAAAAPTVIPGPSPATVVQVIQETLSRQIQEAVAEHIYEAVAKQIHDAVAEQLQVLQPPNPSLPNIQKASSSAVVRQMHETITEQLQEVLQPPNLPLPIQEAVAKQIIVREEAAVSEQSQEARHPPNPCLRSPPSTSHGTPPITASSPTVDKSTGSTPATPSTSSSLAPTSSLASPGSRPPPAKARALFERRRTGLSLGDGKSVRQRCIESRGGRELSVEVPLPRRVFSSMRKTSTDSVESLGAEIVANRCSPKSSPELLARCPAQIF